MSYAINGKQIGEAKAKISSGSTMATVVAKQGKEKPVAKKVVKLASAGKKGSLTRQGRAPRQRTAYE